MWGTTSANLAQTCARAEIKICKNLSWESWPKKLILFINCNSVIEFIKIMHDFGIKKVKNSWAVPFVIHIT